VALRPPSIPFVSNRTGRLIDAEQATSPRYWAEHLRHPVRFGDSLKALLATPGAVLIEVGPGHTLQTLVRNQAPAEATRLVVTSLPGPHEGTSPLELLLRSAGRLWLTGATLDWQGLHAGEERRRVPLPPCPFEGRRYSLLMSSKQAEAQAGRAAEAADHEPETGRPRPRLSLHPRPALATPHVAPRTELEEQVADVWQQVLGIEMIGVFDAFFELGGNSLSATQIVARLQELFPVEMEVRAVLEETATVASLAGAITEQMMKKIEQLTEDEASELLG
jgi:phthiocerol/phenolphthiocerol synthesis type-I polyketide synthase E